MARAGDYASYSATDATNGSIYVQQHGSKPPPTRRKSPGLIRIEIEFAPKMSQKKVYLAEDSQTHLNTWS